jgi:two-component system response regulator AlgR
MSFYLDIRMPVMDGIACAEELARLPNPPAVIFITAFDEHALAAFQVEAIGYLLKPVRRDQLNEALARASRVNRAQLQHIREQVVSTMVSQKLVSILQRVHIVA